jgi:hypothetical protein
MAALEHASVRASSRAGVGLDVGSARELNRLGLGVQQHLGAGRVELRRAWSSRAEQRRVDALGASRLGRLGKRNDRWLRFGNRKRSCRRRVAVLEHGRRASVHRQRFVREAAQRRAEQRQRQDDLRTQLEHVGVLDTQYDATHAASPRRAESRFARAPALAPRHTFWSAVRVRSAARLTREPGCACKTQRRAGAAFDCGVLATGPKGFPGNRCQAPRH